MKPVVRFAPSPTGFLHVGNIRTALINWLFAKKEGGTFILRSDDTDLARSELRFEEAIKHDLSWLGLIWDQFFRQSERMQRYAEAAAQLKAMGRLYPCYETPAELELKRKVLLSRGQPPIYDREGLHLTAEHIENFEKEGRKPHWRFKLDTTPIEWHDMCRGEVKFLPEHLSDPVLIREDNIPLFTFSTVVDDIDTKITHIIRGEDHVSNTAVQVQIFAALQAKPPVFAHLPLITDKEGHGFSKRLGSLSIAELQKEGIEKGAILSTLAYLGTPHTARPIHNVEDLLSDFLIQNYGRATPKFDAQDMLRLNSQIVHELRFDEIKTLPELTTFQAYPIEALWPIIKNNLNFRHDFIEWCHICFDEPFHFELSIESEDKAFFQEALEIITSLNWDETIWKTLTTTLSERTSRKGKQLFKPLRLALTGFEEGPEMSQFLPLMPKSVAQARLKQACQS